MKYYIIDSPLTPKQREESAAEWLEWLKLYEKGVTIGPQAMDIPPACEAGESAEGSQAKQGTGGEHNISLLPTV